MSLTEKVSYLRGLADGMGIKEENSNEQKLLLKILEVLDDMAENVEENNESLSALADELDELDDVVSEMEEAILEIEDDEDDEDDDDDEDDENELEGEVEFLHYELDCPECGGPVVLDEETIQQGTIVCPNCNKTLEIDLGYEDELEEEVEEVDK